MTEDEIKNSISALFRAMAELKTNMAIDSKGVVWAYGRWYGGRGHFRANLGDFSEMVLKDDMLEDRMPFRPYLDESPVSPDAEAWADHFLRPLGRDETPK